MIGMPTFAAVVGVLVAVDLAGLGIAVVNSRQMATREDVEAAHDRIADNRDRAETARREARRARYESEFEPSD